MLEPDSDQSFGEVLKELRNRKKLSRNILAQRIGKHQSTIEKWEKGDVSPDLASVKELIAALRLQETEKRLLLEAYIGIRVLPSLHNLPAHRNPYFVGRETYFPRLHQQLQPGQFAPAMQAICGLGGLGKTQLALEYAYRYHHLYSHVFWVSAESRETLLTELNLLSTGLGGPAGSKKDHEKMAQFVVNWLREYVNWLLIFDNVEDPRLVQEFVPAGYRGSVLLTTRLLNVEPVAQQVVLPVFTPEEGVSFLLQRAKYVPFQNETCLPVEQQESARWLVEQVEGLPLALDQAGAYLVETGCSLTDYRHLWQQGFASLLQRRGTFFSVHHESVTTTFLLAFERMRREHLQAFLFFQRCAFLASERIPQELLCVQLTPGTTMSAALQYDQFLLVLQTYSLVQRERENRSLSLHRLVQVVLRQSMEESEQSAYLTWTIQALVAIFPTETVENWQLGDRLLPHALALVPWLEQYQIVTEEAGTLLQRIGVYLKERGRYKEAQSLLTQALVLRETLLGPSHNETAATLHELAVVHWEGGAYAKADALYQRVQAIREQNLGSVHPDVALLLNDWAMLYYRQGRYDTATKSLLLHALAIYEQVHGPDHSDIVMCKGNLGLLYDSQGHYEQAEQYYQQALAISERLATNNPVQKVLLLISLAELYRQQGNYREIEVFCQRALAMMYQYVGNDHPVTATAQHYFAAFLADAGQYAEAHGLYQQALIIREALLGKEHPSFAATIHKQAELFLAQGAYQQAGPLIRQAYVIQAQQLGEKHASTLITQTTLAEFYAGSGDQKEARVLYQQVIALRKELFGYDHPDTVYALNGLAELSLAQGSYVEAESFYQQALALARPSLLAQHLQVASALRGMADIAVAQQAYQRAEDHYQQALVLQTQAFAISHPAAAKTLFALASLKARQGDELAAADLYKRVLAMYENIYGPQDQRTAAVRQQLHSTT